jgi:chromosome segregation ATPase
VPHRILYLLLMIFGLVGFVICIVAVASAWIVEARINRVTQKVVGAIDDSCVVAGERIAKVQNHVEGLKITAADVERSVTNWSKSIARERLTARVDLDEKAGRLAFGLEQADRWLELTESSAQLAQRALDAASTLAIPVQTEPADRLLEELTSLRNQLTKANETVERLRERYSKAGQEELPDESLHDVTQLIVRVIATLGSIDSRLDSVGERLTEIQHQIRIAERKSLRWLRATAIGITVLVGWMAVGQIALCTNGRRGLCRHKVPI